MKCSLRFCFLSTAFLLVFVMSLLFTYSHHSIAYLDPGGLGSIHRVKLVPGYAGMQRLSKGGPYPRGCACRRCPAEEAGTADWFDRRYDGTVSPVWTKENMDLLPDVQRWWMVSEGTGPPRRRSPSGMALAQGWGAQLSPAPVRRGPLADAPHPPSPPSACRCCSPSSSPTTLTRS